ncbi:15085_t:CDS:1, partial [Racocetra fulgida]
VRGQTNHKNPPKTPIRNTSGEIPVEIKDTPEKDNSGEIPVEIRTPLVNS